MLGPERHNPTTERALIRARAGRRARRVRYRSTCDNSAMIEEQEAPREPAAEVTARFEEGSPDEAVALARELHPADLASVLSADEEQLRDLLLEQLPAGDLGAALEFIEPHYRDDLLTNLPAETIADVLSGVPDDIATDVVQELPSESRARVLAAMPRRLRTAVRSLLAHPEQTAGGRMTGQRIAVRPENTVREVIDFLRELHPDTEHPFYVYVTDSANRLVGLVSTRALLTAHPERPIGPLMQAEIVSVRADTDQEETARLLKRYNLLALPVVDDNDHLLGTVTADDLLDVLEDEATEDMYRMVGVDADEDLRGVASSVRHRLPWLTVNLVTALAAGFVVAQFEGTIARVAILAAFMPVIAGQGGNAGIQTVTVVVRSLALGRIHPGDAAAVLAHELNVGLVIGVVVAVPLALIAWAVEGNVALAVIVGVAMCANVLTGMVMGAVIPLVLHRLGQDPAVSSGIWMTTFTDVLGFLLLLGLAAVFVDALA